MTKEDLDPVLTFVVPVRHHTTVSDWPTSSRLLAQTLASIGNQTSDQWCCVVVASVDTPLPEVPAWVKVVRIDRGAASLPPPGPGEIQERRNEAIRADKGARVLAGLVAVAPAGHVMVVDFDDVVSNRLAEHVAADPDANGWFVDHGGVIDGSPVFYDFHTGFNGLCGTSLIVRADLLGLPEIADGEDGAMMRRRLGSHIFLVNDLAEAGKPLSPLPFRGALYRVGHGGSVSSSQSIRGWFFRKRLLATRPWVFLRRTANLRPVNRRVREEFFAGQSPS